MACDAQAPPSDFADLQSERSGSDVLRVLPELQVAGEGATPVEPYVRKGVAGAVLASDVRLQPSTSEDGLELSEVKLTFTGEAEVPSVTLNRDDIGPLLRYRGNAFHRQGTIRHAPPEDGNGPAVGLFTHGLRLEGGGLYGIGRGVNDDAWGYLVRTSGDLGGYRDARFLYPKDAYDAGTATAIIERIGTQDEVFVAGVVRVGNTRHSLVQRFRSDDDGVLEQVDWTPFPESPTLQVELDFPGCSSTEVTQLAWDDLRSNLYAAGVKRCGPTRRAFVARLLPDGDLDPAYGVQGVAELDAPGGVTADPGGLVIDVGSEEAWVALGVGGACSPGVNGACDPAVVHLGSDGALDDAWGSPATWLAGVPGWVGVHGAAQERAAFTGMHRNGTTGALTLVGWAERAVSMDFMAARLDAAGVADLAYGPDATSHVLYSTPAIGDDLRTAGVSPNGVAHFVSERALGDGRTRLIVERHAFAGTVKNTSSSLPQRGMLVGTPFFHGERMLVPGGVEAVALEPGHTGPGPLGASFTRFRDTDFRLDWAGILEDGVVQQLAWPDLPDLPVPWPEHVRIEVGFADDPHLLEHTVALVEPEVSYEFPLNHEQLVSEGLHPRIRNGAHHDYRAHHRKSVAQVYALDMNAMRWRPTKNASYDAYACAQAFQDDPDGPLPQGCDGDWSKLSSYKVTCPDDGKCNERYAAWGMPIHAMESGRVLGCWKTADENATAGDKTAFREGSMPGGGNILYVLHDDGTVGLYAHMVPPNYEIDAEMFAPRGWGSLSSAEKSAVKGRAVERAQTDPDLDPDNLTLEDFEEQMEIDLEADLDRLRETIDALEKVCPVEHTEYDANVCARPFSEVGNGMYGGAPITVTRGQVLGAVGNSGNSTGPHLHAHVQQGFVGESCNLLDPTVPTDYEIGMPMPFTMANRIDDVPWGPAWWDVSWGGEAVPPPVTDEDGDVTTRIHLEWHPG